MDKIDRFKQITNEMAILYAEKNKNYGDSFSKSYEKFGLISPIIRLTDKINRLESLANQASTGTNDESIMDTLIDLANYSILTILEIENEK